jgi:hypothetical protein
MNNPSHGVPASPASVGARGVDASHVRSPGARRPPPAILVALLATGMAAALGGCSTATLTAGASLAKAGQTASAQMEQNATISSDSLAGFKRAVAFNDGYNGAIGNEDSAAVLTHMTSVQRKLKQYGKLLESLSASYSALGDLSSYDASGSFNTSIQSLATDTEKFSGAIGSPVQVPADVTQGLKVAGGAAIGALQARQVKAASAKIEVVLNEIIALLDSQATRDQLVPAQDQTIGQIDQAAVTLFANGVYAYDPLLDQFGAPMGMKSTPASEGIVDKNPKIQAGLRNVAVQMANDNAASVAASYDASLAALKALVPLHESLAHDAPLNLAQLITVTGQLQSIAASLQASSGASAKASGK